MQAMFLGPLSAIEAGKLSERMLKFLMLKLVFIAAVSGPDMPEIAVWVSWWVAAIPKLQQSVHFYPPQGKLSP